MILITIIVIIITKLSKRKIGGAQWINRGKGYNSALKIIVIREWVTRSAFSRTN